MKYQNALLIAISLFTFSVYAGDPIWDANKVDLVSERLSDGVYYFHAKDAMALKVSGGAGATSGGFITGSKGTLMIETMLNKKLFNKATDLIKKSVKTPVLYAVNTSAHGDHSFGNMYLSKNIKVIQHVNTANYIAEHFNDDKEFMIQNFGVGRGIESITARSADLEIPANGKLILDLGGVNVEIIDFGFAQTGGDLFIWEPNSKILFAGNAIVAPKPGVPWLLAGHVADTLATLQKVYDFLPSDARVIPGHSLVMTKEDIKWHIDYLLALQKNVAAEIKAGANEKDISSRVPMKEYSGYAVYGWIHSLVNVPAAYREAKK